MGSKDLHIQPFDKGTLAKLSIFEDYAEAWIPTFVMISEPEIHIFDLFAGPGYDFNEEPGSPIRILKKINLFLFDILLRKTKIVLHLNEFEPNKTSQKKFELLKINCDKFCQDNPKLKYFLTIEYYNERAESLFFKFLPTISKFPSLVFLDQNGIKFISKEYIIALEKLTKVDFLFFVSSSYFKRLGMTEEFRRVLNFDFDELERENYKNIHRLVLNKIKSSISPISDLKLFPFSIKKGANIFGIIFGAKHYLAVDKFLSIAWQRNNMNGEADFDIDDDLCKGQLNLFTSKAMTKIERFQAELECNLMNGTLKTNKDVLIFTYTNGHIPTHASVVLKKLKGIKLTYESRSPYITYENVFRKNNIISYNLLK